MQFHEVASLFPLMSAEEFAALAADIRQNGLREPLWTFEGKIIDGRNRYLACEESGIEPVTREWDGKGSLVMFVVSLNLHRRHLSSSQKAALAVDVLPLLEGEARQRQLAAQNNNAARAVPQKVAEQAKGDSREQAAGMFKTNHSYVSDAKKLKEENPEKFEAVRSGEKTITQAKREVNAEKMAALKAEKTELPSGKYACIVIDPPWEMKKIERNERPNQVGFEYPTMNEEELKAFPLPDFAADDCHLYLWTTHKHLPMALRLAEHWGFKYECLMTWVKNVGFTPYSWMRSTEHVLFCRKGNLQLERVGLRLDFQAKVREHSRKPEVFYELIKQVSSGPRIDVFSREPHEGFQSWGNEVRKFEAVA